MATTLQCRETLRWIGQSELADNQKRQARAAVCRMYYTSPGQDLRASWPQAATRTPLCYPPERPDALSRSVERSANIAPAVRH